MNFLVFEGVLKPSNPLALHLRAVENLDCGVSHERLHFTVNFLLEFIYVGRRDLGQSEFQLRLGEGLGLGEVPVLLVDV